MTDVLAGLLSAALVTNSPAAPSNLVAQPTNIPVSIVQTNDPVEVEYQNLIALDDDTMREVEKWTDAADTAKTDEAKREAVTLHLRIQQRIDTVRHAYDGFLQHHPDHAKAHLAYGSFLNEIGAEEEAVNQWEKSRALNPGNPAAWNNLGNYYGHRGPVTNAFIYYAKAIDINSNEPIYYQNLAVTVYLYRPDAEAFYHLNENQVFDKALLLYREALRRDPDNFILATDYAESFYGTIPPRYEEGLVAWNQALKIAHDDVEREGVYLHFARINLKLSRFSESHRWLDQVTNSGYAVLKRRIAANLAESETNRPAAPR